MLNKVQLCMMCLILVSLSTSRLTEGNNIADCKNNSDCDGVTQYSICDYGYCTCDYGCYNYTDVKSSNGSKCVACPEIGQSCLHTNCCQSSGSLNVLCENGVCVSECYFCWPTDSDHRYRFEQIAQFILGSALFFTLAILFILFWKACTRRRNGDEHMPHCESFISINSIQRLVLLRLQDRPPPYSSFAQNSKNNTSQNDQRQIVYEEPPPYSSVISPANSDGIINQSFYIGEQPTSQTRGDISNSDQQSENVYKPEIHM